MKIFLFLWILEGFLIFLNFFRYPRKSRVSFDLAAHYITDIRRDMSDIKLSRPAFTVESRDFHYEYDRSINEGKFVEFSFIKV